MPGMARSHHVLSISSLLRQWRSSFLLLLYTSLLKWPRNMDNPDCHVAGSELEKSRDFRGGCWRNVVFKNWNADLMQDGRGLPKRRNASSHRNCEPPKVAKCPKFLLKTQSAIDSTMPPLLLETSRSDIGRGYCSRQGLSKRRVRF
jgi:hypothetical protein